MKRLFALLLVGCFSLALAACGGSSSSSETDDSTAVEEAPAMEPAPADTVEMDSTSMGADSTAM